MRSTGSSSRACVIRWLDRAVSWSHARATWRGELGERNHVPTRSAARTLQKYKRNQREVATLSGRAISSRVCTLTICMIRPPNRGFRKRRIASVSVMKRYCLTPFWTN